MNKDISNSLRHFACWLAVVAAVIGVVRASAQSVPSTNPAELPQLKPGVVAGYIPRDKLIDSLALLPPPPIVPPSFSLSGGMSSTGKPCCAALSISRHR